MRWLDAQSIEHDGELVRAARDRRGRPLARLCERPGGAAAGLARTGGVPHRNPRPTRIPAPGEPRRTARAARRALERSGAARAPSPNSTSATAPAGATSSRSKRPPRTATRGSICCATSSPNSRPRSPRRPPSRSCSPTRSASPAAAAWRRRPGPRSTPPTKRTATARTICWARRTRRCAASADADPQLGAAGEAAGARPPSSPGRPRRRCGAIWTRSTSIRRARRRSSATPPRSRRWRASTASACWSCPAQLARIEQEIGRARQRAAQLGGTRAATGRADARLSRRGAAPDARRASAPPHALGHGKSPQLMQALGMAGGRFAVSVEPERRRNSAPTAATRSSSW